MKNILIVGLLIFSTLYADEFDLGDGTEEKEDGVVYPVSSAEFDYFFPSVFKATQKEIREFIPLIPSTKNFCKIHTKR